MNSCGGFQRLLNGSPSYLPGLSDGLKRTRMSMVCVSSMGTLQRAADTHTMLMRVRFKPSDNPGKYEGDPFSRRWKPPQEFIVPVSYTHLRAHETPEHLV